MDESKSHSAPAKELPPGRRIQADAVAGFLVFLIALPLCLAIAKASGYPPIGGVITAIVGGIVTSLISNSELTIKGPAAGLIAIVAACVADMAKLDPSSASEPFPGYRYALAVGVVAAGFQVLFGLFKAGKLGDFFPTAVVHGLLASIGVIIMLKQFLAMLGVSAKLPAENTHLIKEYPHFMSQYNLPVMIIGLASLAVMVIYPLLKLKALKAIPSQLVVLMIAAPLALGMGLKQPASQGTGDRGQGTGSTSRQIVIGGKTWSLDSGKYLINVPTDFTKAFVLPKFEALKQPLAWKWVAMFAIIASLESLLSAKAVDVLDPQKRKTDLNRDLFACGVANLITSAIGGLPMISEIVRSRANVDNGAQTRLANLFHGLCLLLFVALLPWVVNMIPVAALSAMLVFTGFRLAHPKEFLHMYQIGMEQFVVFVTTIVAIVCTDLLVGSLIGLAVELVINVLNGLPITSIFSAGTTVEERDGGYVLKPRHAAVFSNWLTLRGKIEELGLKGNKNIVVDLSRTKLVDHTVMEKLHDMQREFRLANLELKVVGLEKHSAFSPHPAAARKLQDHAMAV